MLDLLLIIYADTQKAQNPILKRMHRGVQNSTGGLKISVEKWSGWTKNTGKNGPPDRLLVGPIFRWQSHLIVCAQSKTPVRRIFQATAICWRSTTPMCMRCYSVRKSVVMSAFPGQTSTSQDSNWTSKGFSTPAVVSTSVAMGVRTSFVICTLIIARAT